MRAAGFIAAIYKRKTLVFARLPRSGRRDDELENRDDRRRVSNFFSSEIVCDICEKRRVKNFPNIYYVSHSVVERSSSDKSRTAISSRVTVIRPGVVCYTGKNDRRGYSIYITNAIGKRYI